MAAGFEISDQLRGTKELSDKLVNLGRAVGGKTLRSAAMSAALPALRAIQAAAPVGNFLYSVKRSDDGSKRLIDPYPVRGWRKRLRGPGFLKRSIKRKAILSDDKSRVTILIGPTLEGFYGRWTEFGKTTSPKKPWLEPAFRSQIGPMQQRLADRLRVLVDKAAKGSSA